VHTADGVVVCVQVPRPPVGELPDVICLDGAGDDPAAALAAAEIALLDNNYHTADGA
jgi:hypothetical protein